MSAVEPRTEPGSAVGGALSWLLFGVGGLLLAVAAFLLWDGSSWGGLIAAMLATWAFTALGWGFIVGVHDSAIACIAGAVLAGFATVLAVGWMVGGWWPFAVVSAVGSPPAVVLGAWRARKLLRRPSQ